MYKVTIIETVGEIRKETIVETEDADLIKQILGVHAEDVHKVESDEPNLMINERYNEFRRHMDEIFKYPKTEPYPDPKDWKYEPFVTNPLYPRPFDITC